MPTNMRGRLTNAPDITRFALAGNATLTLVSEKTKQRYTYKVRRAKAEARDDNDSKPAPAPELWFVSVLYGPDNEQDFAYIGIIKPMGFFHTRKSRVSVDDARVKTFAWFWHHVNDTKHMPPKAEVWHEGRCCRCGRKLTVPSSIENGIGPECIKHFGARQVELPIGETA